MRKGQQLPWIVSDELWQRIEPLLPKIERRYRHPGRKRLDDRKALCGILFVLYTAIPWEFLPQELGFGSGMTCWRRLRDWHQAGVWDRLHQVRSYRAWYRHVTLAMTAATFLVIVRDGLQKGGLRPVVEQG